MARSIVEYFSEHEGYRCGYCKSEDTNYSRGMWAHVLTAQDYQALIDRGWRRSGCYCYKPTMTKTCCPMYTIKCAALQFRLSRSQKRILKKFKYFIEKGEITGSRGQPADQKRLNHESVVAERSKRVEARLGLGIDGAGLQHNALNSRSDESTRAPPLPLQNSGGIAEFSLPMKQYACATFGSSARGVMKAKAFRRERWRQRLLARGMEVVPRQPRNAAKSLEERLSLSERDFVKNSSSRHRFEVRLVATTAESFVDTFAESLAVYQRYQVAVHGDTLEKCSATQFKRFLCKSPLVPTEEYGTFHRQYLIDGRIVAVGVLDILPHCVSSVYLFYDPAYSQLSLGTYTSLSEIAFVRELHRRRPELQFYYLGFYIYSCPKMKYKGQYTPSFLSCPESYSWIPLELCSSLLSLSPYSRLQQDASYTDPDVFTSMKDIKVLFCRQVMEWEVYRGLLEGDNMEELEEVMEYGCLVGQRVAARMLLFRGN